MFKTITGASTTTELAPARRYVAVCKCGFKAAFNAAPGKALVGGKWAGALLVEGGAVVALSNKVATCTCGREILPRTLEIRITEHVCSAICRQSTGHRCDCSCGGKYHGAGFGLAL